MGGSLKSARSGSYFSLQIAPQISSQIAPQNNTGHKMVLRNGFEKWF
jgi:hypothetical protein